MNSWLLPTSWKECLISAKLDAERKGLQGPLFIGLTSSERLITSQIRHMPSIPQYYTGKRKGPCGPLSCYLPIANFPSSENLPKIAAQGVWDPLQGGKGIQTGKPRSPVNPYGETIPSMPSTLTGPAWERKAKPKLQDQVTCKSYHAACCPSHDGEECG
jgi:hypothetical protein